MLSFHIKQQGLYLKISITTKLFNLREASHIFFYLRLLQTIIQTKANHYTCRVALSFFRVLTLRYLPVKIFNRSKTSLAGFREHFLHILLKYIFGKFKITSITFYTLRYIIQNTYFQFFFLLYLFFTFNCNFVCTLQLFFRPVK